MENTPSKLLTMAELAKRLDLPESTLRYYCKTFDDYLPHQGQGRRKRFTPEAEGILRFIAQAMHKNKNATAVSLMLAAGQGRGMTEASATGAPVPAARAASASVPAVEELLGIMERQASALSSIASKLGTLVERMDGGEACEDEKDESWRDEAQQIRQQIATSEQLHQEDLEQIRKWLGRLNEAVTRLG